MKKKPDKGAGSPILGSGQSITRIFINIACVGALLLPHTGVAKPLQTEIFKEDNSKLRLSASIRLELDDNVFRLDDNGKSRLTAAEERNITSGRLTKMESISDHVISTNFELQYELPKFKGPEATIKAEITHHHYQKNHNSSYFDGQIRLTGRLSQNQSIRLQTEFTLDRFRKNYLSSVTDLNSNGNVPINERHYAPGIFNEVEQSIAYRHRFRLFQHKESRDLKIHIIFGGIYRNYEDPLTNRDREGAFGAFRFEGELSPQISLELELRRENISTPGENEIILVDETEAGFDQDMNGDIRIKRNAPLNTAINRSRIRDTRQLETIWNINNDWRAIIGYRHKKSNFTSQNSLDVDHYGATETGNRLKASLRWRLNKSWFITFIFQRTDSEDLEELGRDQGKYRQERVGVTIRHRFD